MTLISRNLLQTARYLGRRMVARFQSFTLVRIARDACSRQSGCSRLTPP